MSLTHCIGDNDCTCYETQARMLAEIVDMRALSIPCVRRRGCLYVAMNEAMSASLRLNK